MNGRKYGHNYAPRAHGFNLRAKAFPVGYYAPKRPYRLQEAMWDNLIGRMKRVRVYGDPTVLWWDKTKYGCLFRRIDYGKTLGWWERVFEN